MVGLIYRLASLAPTRLFAAFSRALEPASGRPMTARRRASRRETFKSQHAPHNRADRMPPARVRRRAPPERILVALVLAAVLAGPLHAAHATVTPSVGGARDSFTVYFPPQDVALELLGLRAPLREARSPVDLDPAGPAGTIQLRPRARRAAWPRRNGKRLLRWCRGRYNASVLVTSEFGFENGGVLTRGEFRVR